MTDPNIVLHRLLCEDCAENHLENTQSISCYCHCHSSSHDEKHLQENLKVIMEALRAERELP